MKVRRKDYQGLSSRIIIKDYPRAGFLGVF